MCIKNHKKSQEITNQQNKIKSQIKPQIITNHNTFIQTNAKLNQYLVNKSHEDASS